MESISSTASLFTPTFKCFDPSNLYSATFDSRNSSVNYSSGLKSRATKTNGALTMDGKSQLKIVTGEAGFVLEDVPHLSDYIQDLPTYPNPLQDNPAYSVVKQYFVNEDDTVAQKVTTPAGGSCFR